MSRTFTRSSQSSSGSAGRLTTKLQPAIDGLSSSDTSSVPRAVDAAEHLLFLRHSFIDDEKPREVRDVFRQLRGFQVLVGFLRVLADLYDPASLGQEDRKSLFTVATNTLGALAEALKEHHVNKRYFAKNVQGGGIASLEQVLSTFKAKSGQDTGGESCADAEQFYGGLLAAGLGQGTVSNLFTAVRKKFDDSEELPTPGTVKDVVNRLLGTTETVENPEFFGPLVRLWLSQSSDSSGSPVQQLAIPACLGRLAIQSQRNCLALHSTGMLTVFLRLMVEDKRSENEIAMYSDVASLLCANGINDLTDAAMLFRSAHNCPRISRFLLGAIKSSKQPPFIQFDLSRAGYASAELSTLGRPFPPTSSSGYTLALWARFDYFDPDAHTTIFGAFDPTQTCFLLAYLEKDTRNFILQTSIKGARPSVRFKSTVFVPGQWYHICVVHRKPRPTSSSRAVLFINGEFVEQLKAEYPTAPTTRSGQKPGRIQAFLGTPQDLAAKIGKGVSNSQWSSASAVLFEDAFNDDIISVLSHLGPRYHANFQDCLGSFQTYRASAALNLRNESLHPGKEDSSDIVSVIRRKASFLIPESCVLLNLSPMAVLDDDDRNNVDESQLVKSLSKQAAKNLHTFTRSGNSVVINGAAPAINDALTRSHGVAVLVGDPVVSVPQSLDDASWRTGGCPAVHLSMIEAATTSDCVRLAVEILFESIEDSWRNSEAMEKENGYGILAVLLREKLGFPSFQTSAKIQQVCNTAQERNDLAMDLLVMILKFMGYNFDNPKKSIVVNPLAYRVLLVDLEIWRLGDLPLLEIYYSQFRALCIESHHHRFNARRLSRMRVVKRFIEALKHDTFTEESLKLFIIAFKSLIICSTTAEMLRSVALFITYSTHKVKEPKTVQKKKSIRFDMRPRRTIVAAQAPGLQVSALSKERIGAEILRIYADILCGDENTLTIKKFARTVTNKWLLYLISEDDPEVVLFATKILARLLVVHGSSYIRKFADKSGGFVIMRHRLKRWWHLAPLWPICFGILFGQDVSSVDFDRPFDATSFLEMFGPMDNLQIVYPEMLPIIVGMLQSGVKSALSRLPPEQNGDGDSNVGKSSGLPKTPSSASVWSLASGSSMPNVDLLNLVSHALNEFHSRSQNFRDFAASPLYIGELLSVLFPVVVGSDTVNAGLELDSHRSGLSVGGGNVVIQPLSEARQVLHTTTVEPSGLQEPEHPLRRGSSFVLVSSDKAKYTPSPARLRHIVVPKNDASQADPAHSMVQGVLQVILTAFTDQLLSRKDFAGLLLYLKTPPGFVEHQTYFESWLLRKILYHLGTEISSNQDVLLDPRVLTNLARFLAQVAEAVFEGWFIDGATPSLEFIGPILEFLQKPEISCLKSIRLCSQAISTICSILFRIVLLRLSEAEGPDALSFLQRLTYWQTVLLSAGEKQPEHLHLICYLLYVKLVTDQEDVRLAASNLWRVILVQKPSEISAMLNHTSSSLQKRLTPGFQTLVGMEDENFLHWIDDQRDDLDCFFFGSLSKTWEGFVRDENSKTEDTARSRLSKRKDKLKQWSQMENANEEVIRKHDITFGHWTSNIQASENLKTQRALQDQQDDFVFLSTAFSRIYRALRHGSGLLAQDHDTKWRLDQTEGRSRMRLRIIPDDAEDYQDYQPKRKTSVGVKEESRALPVRPASTGTGSETVRADVFESSTPENDSDDKSGLEESFEMIDDPKDDEGDYEDKNRKVMRSLHRGDQVRHVCNIARIVGLDACEGLLILGKDNLYIMDNFFQRADGEIVNVWHAPPEERDPYLGMISGRESKDHKVNNGEHETRSWKWAELISVSKRRFLFRDVALEIFFADGRSYLLTSISPPVRDELYSHLSSRAPQIHASSSTAPAEDMWRFDTLRSQDRTPQFFGSKFVNTVFSQSQSHPATRKWVKGEMSNFHYLMLVNTLAGRTFNDLTQYPVFPWVIADYTSEELDLTNPRTFRDLTKPMGCQTIERETRYRDRYKSFAEMGDDRAFHFGTHYSSALIVSSYLIRLQPFVKAYLSIQGSTFDHADRLFFSVSNAWESAAKSSNADVRELTPEFYYLPEFLLNLNKYNFGVRQNATEAIDSVQLPPWAKGDPKIFISKQREALESPYVSQNLHHWIDLVFGFKQRGEAAVEAVNVFHYMTYQGAKDLDTIEDPVERLSDINMIHHFGQTPHQVFTRSHPRRDELQSREDKLDVAAESLTLLPFPLLESDERVSSLSFSVKQDRLLCSAAFRLNIPPNYDRYLEWGFFDGSVRIYAAESRKLIGHFEHLHVGQLSCALFADSHTLITSGTDCTVSVWAYTSSTKSVDLVPNATLLGHNTPVTVLAVSRSFSTVLSVSKDGNIMLWDLNRLEFVRRLPNNGPVDCARINDATGNILICRDCRISLYNLNGALLIDQSVWDRPEDTILSCAFYEGPINEWIQRELLFTGHRRGLVNVWSKSIKGGKFELELVRQLHHVDTARGDGTTVPAGITYILPQPQVVYTGDENGRVYEWDCVLRR